VADIAHYAEDSEVPALKDLCEMPCISRHPTFLYLLDKLVQKVRKRQKSDDRSVAKLNISDTDQCRSEIQESMNSVLSTCSGTHTIVPLISQGWCVRVH